MKRLVCCLAIAGITLSLVSAANAQLSAVASPNPAPQGTAVTFSIEATTSTQLRLACPIEVRQGSPAGPVVWRSQICIGLLVMVGPGRPYTRMGWPGTDLTNQPVAPGDYFVLIEHTGGPWLKHWVPVRVDPLRGPFAPALAPTGAFARGQTTGVTITSAGDAGKQYELFASFTTNKGFALGAQHVALDADGLFFLSAIRLPGLFTNLSNTLSASGQGTGAIAIPNLPALQGQNLSFQGLVVDGTRFKFSNAISGIIQ